MTIQKIAWNESFPEESRRGAVTIGNFDGVHRGHLALITELRRQAVSLAGPAVAFTFDPHPLQLLQPARFMPVLTTVADRAELLRASGVDHVLVVRTTPELLRLTAREFFQEVLCRRLGARAVVEGTNFRFGRNREGSAETLATLAREADIRFVAVETLLHHGLPVSSSRVRTALVRGAVRDAAALLGRPYRLSGMVGTGQRRGQTIGFPTANLEGVETLVPGDGVYAVRVFWEGQSWPGAANLGPNPTFNEEARKVEVHLIGFQGTLYGQRLTVEFVERLRDIRLFSGIEQLVAQLGKDMEQAKRLAS